MKSSWSQGWQRSSLAKLKFVRDKVWPKSSLTADRFGRGQVVALPLWDSVSFASDANWCWPVLRSIGETVVVCGEVMIGNLKGVFNLSSQLSNFSKDWGMQRGIIEFCRFHGLISSHFCYSCSKIAMFPTIFTGKHVKFFEISLETMTWGN